MNSVKMNELFDKLESMLDNINPECISLLDDIRSIPGTSELARQIEDYDFEAASATLARMKRGDDNGRH